MKEITICGKEYKIECNALTYVKYKSMFNKGVFEDIKVLQNFLSKQVLLTQKLKNENPDVEDEAILTLLSSVMIDDMDLFMEAATRLAYIMIYTANKKIESYEDWLSSIPAIKTNDDWIVEVTEFAVTCFC